MEIGGLTKCSLTAVIKEVSVHSRQRPIKLTHSVTAPQSTITQVKVVQRFETWS